MIKNLSSSDLEVVVIHVGEVMDSVTRDIENSVDELVHITVPWDYARGGNGKEFEQLRSALFDLKLDVLVWLNPLGSTLTWLLTFTRFAPLQVATVGTPVTTGVSGTMDVYLGIDA